MKSLEELVAEWKIIYEQMTPEQKSEMRQKQRESYVRGEMGWPKPKFKIINGVKTYESYEDYCND